MDRLGLCASAARQGRDVEDAARCSWTRARSTSSTCCPRPATACRPSSTCSNTTWSISAWRRPRRPASIDMRWQEEVTGLEQTSDGVLLDVATPAGPYRLAADWVIAADGARSTLRRLMGLGFEGRVFQHQFLICDIKIRMDRPAERLFWFDPPFNRGLSALLHKQADDVWRLDFQVGDEADREAEVKPENAARRVRAACSARTSISRSSGSASTASSRAACSASATAACCLPATPRTRCRRSARAAATAACRTPTISFGSSIWCCAAWRRSGCSTATTPSASTPPTRTCSTPPAPRISWRPSPGRARSFATASWRWPRPSRSRAGWSTPVG